MFNRGEGRGGGNDFWFKLSGGSKLQGFGNSFKDHSFLSSGVVRNLHEIEQHELKGQHTKCNYLCISRQVFQILSSCYTVEINMEMIQSCSSSQILVLVDTELQ